MSQSLVDRLQHPDPMIGVELRPPRADLSGADSMNVWIDMYHAIQRLVRQDAVVFLTDNAVGQAEEENLAHLVSNVGQDVDRAQLVPFLTTKHTLDYCHLYARRAASFGFNALTVLGGDKHVGPPRCVPHGYLLRQSIRKIVPEVQLGGWANPLADPVGQVDFLLDAGFTADFFLTQIVSHHSIREVEAFLNEMERRRVPYPGVFGVFYYRSANRKTLQTLGEFFPVPVDGIAEDFASGLSPAEVCIKSIRALNALGINKVYVSNLGIQKAGRTYRTIVNALDR